MAQAVRAEEMVGRKTFEASAARVLDRVRKPRERDEGYEREHTHQERADDEGQRDATGVHRRLPVLRVERRRGSMTRCRTSAAKPMTRTRVVDTRRTP